jgi:hypothetical protein
LFFIGYTHKKSHEKNLVADNRIDAGGAEFVACLENAVLLALSGLARLPIPQGDVLN